MSKIYDALRKSAGHGGAETPPPSDPDPAPVPPAEAAGEAEPRPLPRTESPARDGGEIGLSDTFSRELARLRSSIEQILHDKPHRSILFTGSVPGEGASTVSARFAQRLGEDPRLRVALVDGDLRNQDPRPVEPVDPGEGFASILAGRLEIDHALRPTGLPGLDVIPSEGVAGDPYALCTSDAVTPSLAALRSRYPYVILDAAPVLVAPETALLAAEVDGVVLVVRAGRTKREVIRRALDLLAKYEAPVIGVVMNRQRYVIPEFIYRRL